MFLQALLQFSDSYKCGAGPETRYPYTKTCVNRFLIAYWCKYAAYLFLCAVFENKNLAVNFWVFAFFNWVFVKLILVTQFCPYISLQHQLFELSILSFLLPFVWKTIGYSRKMDKYSKKQLICCSVYVLSFVYLRQKVFRILVKGIWIHFSNVTCLQVYTWLWL